MKSTITSIAIAALLSGFPAAAQPQLTMSGESSRRDVSSQRQFSLENNVWNATNNPTTISFYELGKASGSAGFSADYLAGAYRRAMDPSEDYSLGFSTDSYNSLDNIDLYGSFAFTQETLKGKKYSENYDPYNGNPYLAGSTLEGDYTKQLFEFNVAASSKVLSNRMRFGVSIDYNVGDMSRYNDPRSRVQLADYSITPGFIIDLTPKDRIGLSGTYRYRKEKMLKPVAKSENLDRYMYCLQKGLSEYSETGLLFFSRRYVGNYGGGELQYSHMTPNLSLVVHGGATYRYDDVIGERKENPGNYSSIDYHGGVSALWGNGRLRHKAVVGLSYISGDAEECLQELTTETNEQGMPDSYWRTVMKNIRYRNSLSTMSALWQISGLRGGKYSWDVGVAIDASVYSSKYILPKSDFHTAYLEPSLIGGCLLYSKGNSEINISGRLGWHQSLTNKLSTNPELENEKLTTIRDNVTIPDYQTFSRSGLMTGLNLNYIFASLKSSRLYCSVSTNQCYALSTPKETPSTTPTRIWSSISIGIIY